MTGMVKNSYRSHLEDRLDRLKKQYKRQAQFGPSAKTSQTLMKWLKSEIKSLEETLESASKVREDADK